MASSLHFWRRVRRFFITTFLGGLVVILPIGLFIIGVNFLVRTVSRLVIPIKNLMDLPEGWASWLVDLVAVSAVVTTFFLIGLLVRTNTGKKLWANIDRYLLSQLPVYPTLRDTVQQFLGNQDKLPFSEVVSVDVFGNQTRMIGFISDQIGEENYSIFVPTGPNPTNGFVFCVHEQQIQRLEIRPEDAMRVVVGVGTGAGALFGLDSIKAIPKV